MELSEMAALFLIGVALAFAGYRIGMLRMKEKVIDFMGFFAKYLRDGNAKFVEGRGGPADLIDELGKSLEDAL